MTIQRRVCYVKSVKGDSYLACSDDRAYDAVPQHQAAHFTTTAPAISDIHSKTKVCQYTEESVVRILPQARVLVQ